MPYLTFYDPYFEGAISILELDAQLAMWVQELRVRGGTAEFLGFQG